jgi:hypothetical protein
MAEKEEKLITDEMKKDAITMESSSSDYGFFDNKYVRAGIATALAVYAAKKEPYMLQGFSEKMEDFAKEDRDARRRFIESSSEGIGRVLAENAARRKERITDFSEKIDQLTEYTGDKYKSASMIKAGQYTNLLKLAQQGANINKLFQVTNEFKGDKGSLTTSQLAGILAGKPIPFDAESQKFIAPRTMSPITNIIKGESQEDVTKDVLSQTKSLTPEAFEKKEDFESVVSKAELGGALTEKGIRFLRPKVTGGMTENAAKGQIMKAIANSLGGELKITFDDVTGLPSYSYDAQIEQRVANASALHGGLLLEVENLMQKVGEGEGFTRREAVQNIIDKYKLGESNTTYEPIREILNKGKKNNNNVKNPNTKPPKNDNVSNIINNLKNKLIEKRKENTKIGQGNKPKLDDRAYLVDERIAIVSAISELVKTPRFENKSAAAEKYIKEQLGIK